MSFASPVFLFAFLPILLALRALAPRRLENSLLLAASVAFYAFGEPWFVFLVVVSALFDHVLVERIAVAPSSRRAAICTGIGIATNLAILVAFKYAGFAHETASALVVAAGGGPLAAIPAFALPIGVSFVVFEKITYLVDVRRGDGRPARSAFDYLLYVFLFPKILAGPIVKYRDLERQIPPSSRHADLAAGLGRFAVGLAKKVWIADAAGELVDALFAPGPAVGFLHAWVGVLAFSVQIYFDFSGYSDMAIGLARALGFRLMENFDRPYLSVGFAEFWRRWHVSLSTWIRDYLYVPLGGSRVGAVRRHRNLWICFLASGLWHGAEWTFVAWGAYHGFFLSLDALGARRVLDRLPKPVAVGLTFLLVSAGWVLFRAPDLGFALERFGEMLDPTGVGERTVIVTGDVAFAVVAGLAIVFAPALLRPLRDAASARLGAHAPTLATAGSLALLVVSAAKVLTVAFEPFLYFRF